jgi:hypothetical protein
MQLDYLALFSNIHLLLVLYSHLAPVSINVKKTLLIFFNAVDLQTTMVHTKLWLSPFVLLCNLSPAWQALSERV